MFSAASKTDNVSSAANYIEDVFSTYLYTGNADAGVGSLNIVNNIDLSTKGGLVWVKPRSGAGGSDPHALYDTNRGASYALSSNLTDAQTYASVSGRELYQFNNDGFSVGPAQNYNVNQLNVPFVSWTFAKQAKFFDVVTYTGNGANRTIAHNLGSVPGCIIVKRTDTTADWQVYHRSLANTEYLVLNTTAAKATGATRWNSTTPTSTVFSLGTDTTVNANGGTYVAYLFAHDAGGFGLTGADNVISCGSFTTNSGSSYSAFTSAVNLGWEPQWVLIKRVDSTSPWSIMDNMRGGSGYGFNVQSLESAQPAAVLQPNTSSSESTASFATPYLYIGPNATGFTGGISSSPSATYIYIAIRRGPMKTPTSGTSVFAPVTYSGTGGSDVTQTTGFPVDFTFNLPRNNAYEKNVFDRLRGWPNVLYTNLSMAEQTNTSYLAFDNSTGVVAKLGSGYPNVTNGSGWTYVTEAFRRAPGFMDVVCYTGTGSAQNINHNLTVAPEMIITKIRNFGTYAWRVYHSGLGNGKALYLNLDNAVATATGFWNDTNPTASVFTVGSDAGTNASGYNMVAYLFASCPGVSKVGSYTGTGTTLQINCGFTSGARFVLIKRTDSTGDWYVWDTARGIVSGNDPYLLLNSTAAEVTNTDYIDAYSAGFEISSTAPAAINASGGTFIYMAIS